MATASIPETFEENAANVLRRRNKIAGVVVSTRLHDLDTVLSLAQADADTPLRVDARIVLTMLNQVTAALGGVEDLRALGLAGGSMAEVQVRVIQESNPVW